jgi:hypothetical protein
MQGQTERLTEDNAPIENAFEYRFFTDNLIPLKNPVGEFILKDLSKGWDVPKNVVADQIREWQIAHALGGSVSGNTNLVPKFCKHYTEITGKKVVAVHTAKGATGVNDWLPDNVVYKTAWKKMQMAIECIKKQFSIDKIYIAWLQGESDAIGGMSTSEYMEKLTQLKNNAKKDFGVDKFGIIKVGQFTTTNRDQAIFEAQETLPLIDSDFLMLSRITEDLIDDPAYMNPYARGHYNSDGQEKIGTHTGTNLALILQGKEPIYK